MSTSQRKSSHYHKKHVHNLKLNIGHLNVYHLANKTHDIAHFFHHQPDVVHLFGLSETRLHEKIDDGILNLPNYVLMRRDSTTQGQLGLAVYIHNTISHLVKRRRDLEHPEVESLWLEIKVDTWPLLVCFIYRNPSANQEWFDKFTDMMDSAIAVSNDILLLGDFNINMLHNQPTWNCITSLFGLKQMVTSPTRVSRTSSTLIDHIYTNNDSLLSNTQVPQTSISDHFPVCCTWTSKSALQQSQGHKEIMFRSFKKFEPLAFLHDLSQMPFSEIYQFTDPDTALHKWYELFLSVLDKHAPLSKKRVKHKQLPPWLTKDIIKAMSTRDRLRRCGKVDEFKKMRNKVTSLVRQAKRNYFQKLINEDQSTSTLWKAINALTKGSQRNSKDSIPSNITAEALNKHFLTAVSTLIEENGNSENCQTYMCPEGLSDFCKNNLSPDVRFSIPFIGIHEVAQLIMKLKNTNTSGLDTISNKVLKLSLPYTADSLTYIYNLCIQNRYFPRALKSAKIIPIQKGTDNHDPNNYRPISLLSSLSKPLERHVHKHLLHYFENNNLLFPAQSGFRPLHSCETALNKLSNAWLTSINKSEMVGAVFLDFRKAFDTVNHVILTKKLKAYQLDKPSIDFFCSYLSNRTQAVRLNGASSTEGLIKHGVPQGSVLGPLLFNIYINDLPLLLQKIQINTEMFADDGTIHKADSSLNTITEHLQNALHLTRQWCLNNQMIIHPGKTKSMLLASRQKHQLKPLKLNLNIQDQCIQQVKEHKVLGVTIDDRLCWQNHIDTTCKSLARKVYLMSRLSQMVDKNTLKVFFHAHVEPLLDYASTLWDGAPEVHFKRLNSLYRRSVKLLLPHTEISTDLKLQYLGLLSLHNKCLYNKLVLMYKILNNKSPKYLLDLFTKGGSQYVNRKNCLKVPFPRIDLFKSSLSYSGSLAWNKLPTGIAQSPSLAVFKSKLKAHLLVASTQL